ALANAEPALRTAGGRRRRAARPRGRPDAEVPPRERPELAQDRALGGVRASAVRPPRGRAARRRAGTPPSPACGGCGAEGTPARHTRGLRRRPETHGFRRAVRVAGSVRTPA